jgi:hypothetical protein
VLICVIICVIFIRIIVSDRYFNDTMPILQIAVYVFSDRIRSPARCSLLSSSWRSGMPVRVMVVGRTSARFTLWAVALLLACALHVCTAGEPAAPMAAVDEPTVRSALTAETARLLTESASLSGAHSALSAQHSALTALLSERTATAAELHRQIATASAAIERVDSALRTSADRFARVNASLTARLHDLSALRTAADAARDEAIRDRKQLGACQYALHSATQTLSAQHKATADAGKPAADKRTATDTGAADSAKAKANAKAPAKAKDSTKSAHDKGKRRAEKAKAKAKVKAKADAEAAKAPPAPAAATTAAPPPAERPPRVLTDSDYERALKILEADYVRACSREPYTFSGSPCLRDGRQCNRLRDRIGGGEPFAGRRDVRWSWWTAFPQFICWYELSTRPERPQPIAHIVTRLLDLLDEHSDAVLIERHKSALQRERQRGPSPTIPHDHPTLPHSSRTAPAAQGRGLDRGRGIDVDALDDTLAALDRVMAPAEQAAAEERARLERCESTVTASGREDVPPFIHLHDMARAAQQPPASP